MERITVKKAASSESIPIFEATFKCCIVPFPVSTVLFPFPLFQNLNGRSYETTFTGSGIGRKAKMTDITFLTFSESGFLEPRLI
jgi:hypothetical protein